MIAETIYLPIDVVSVAVYGALVLFALVILALVGPQAVRDLRAWSRETLPPVRKGQASAPSPRYWRRAVYEACVEHCHLAPKPWGELHAWTQRIYVEYARCVLADLSAKPDTVDDGQRKQELDALLSLTERRDLRLM